MTKFSYLLEFGEVRLWTVLVEVFLESPHLRPCHTQRLEVFVSYKLELTYIMDLGSREGITC